MYRNVYLLVLLIGYMYMYIMVVFFFFTGSLFDSY